MNSVLFELYSCVHTSMIIVEIEAAMQSIRPQCIIQYIYELFTIGEQVLIPGFGNASSLARMVSNSHCIPHLRKVSEILGQGRDVGNDVTVFDIHQPEIDGVSSKISWVSHRKVDYRIMVPCFMETRVNLLTKEMSQVC